MYLGFLTWMLSPFQADAAMGEDAKEGQAALFEQFLREQRAPLLKFLQGRTASLEDAQDVAQESFSRLLRYRDTQLPEAWKLLLYRIAVNLAHNLTREGIRHHRTAHIPLDDVAHGLPDTAPGPHDLSVARQKIQIIGTIVAELPARCREVFLLSRVEGMTNSQIALHCGISVKAVEKHMTRALAAVWRGWGERGLEVL